MVWKDAVLWCGVKDWRISRKVVVRKFNAQFSVAEAELMFICITVISDRGFTRWLSEKVKGGRCCLCEIRLNKVVRINFTSIGPRERQVTLVI